MAGADAKGIIGHEDGDYGMVRCVGCGLRVPNGKERGAPAECKGSADGCKGHVFVNARWITVFKSGDTRSLPSGALNLVSQYQDQIKELS